METGRWQAGCRAGFCHHPPPGDRSRSLDRPPRLPRASYPPIELFASTAETEEATAILELELQRLPDPQREVLTLKFWGGLTFAEVAETLGIPQGTAASRYRMALKHCAKP